MSMLCDMDEIRGMGLDPALVKLIVIALLELRSVANKFTSPRLLHLKALSIDHYNHLHRNALPSSLTTSASQLQSCRPLDQSVACARQSAAFRLVL